MATQDEQKGRWKTAGGNANPRKRKEAVRGLSSPVCRVSGKGDTGCDLAGFLTIFIKICTSVLFILQNSACRNKDNQQGYPDLLDLHIP